MKIKEFMFPKLGDEKNANCWFAENANIKIIDIKYSVCNEYSGCLVIYEEE